MKKIGLIGGITWQSTQLYYHHLNTLIAEKLGAQHSCECIIESVDFAKISAQQAAGNWDDLHNQMLEIGLRLQAAGAEMIVICANTMHLSVPVMEAKIHIPIVHIAAVTGAVIKQRSFRKVLLLGTKFTMELDFYKNILKNNFGIEVLVPSKEDRETVHAIIYEELAKGIIKKESKQAYLKIIDSGIANGAEAVILGCTEIPLLIQQEDCTILAVDTTKEHAKAAIALALS